MDVRRGPAGRDAGRLLPGAHDEADGRLRFVGHVEPGFDRATLQDPQTKLERLARSASPFDEPVPREYARQARGVEPVLVGEVDNEGREAEVFLPPGRMPRRRRTCGGPGTTAGGTSTSS